MAQHKGSYNKKQKTKYVENRKEQGEMHIYRVREL